MKIAYFGYDFFYKCLDLLIKSEHEVIKVFTYKTDNVYNFNEKILDLCNKNDILHQVSQGISDSDIKKLEDANCDLLVSSAYPYKIPTNHSIKGINIHPTLLPNGRGPWPLPYIILNEYKISGVTIHKLTDKMDSGDILIQESFSIMKNEDLETLSIKSQIIAKNILEKLMKNFEKYWKDSKKQEAGSYWPNPTEDMMMLDFNKNTEDLIKIQRAFSQMDTCAIFENKHWLVKTINAWKEKHNYKNATIIHKTNKEILISTNDGFICLKDYREDRDYA